VRRIDPDQQALSASFDPADWLVLSDWYEEHGEAGLAAYWRNIGQWSQILLPELAAYAHRQDLIGESVFCIEGLPGDWFVEIERTPALVRLWLGHPSICGGELRSKYHLDARSIRIAIDAPGTTVPIHEQARKEMQAWLLKRLRQIIPSAPSEGGESCQDR